MTALYIQPESGAISWQIWPVPDAVPPGAVREGASYLFELRDSDDAFAADLLIDDVPVEALRSRDPRVARWRWMPGFHAGLIEVVLRAPGIGTRRFEVTTDPDLRKLTRDDFDVMVREVLEDTFALFSLSSFRKGIARQPGNKPPPLARLEFLRSRVEEIVEAVTLIARSPRHYLRAEDITVAAHRAARAKPRSPPRVQGPQPPKRTRGPIADFDGTLQAASPKSKFDSRRRPFPETDAVGNGKSAESSWCRPATAAILPQYRQSFTRYRPQ